MKHEQAQSNPPLRDPATAATAVEFKNLGTYGDRIAVYAYELPLEFISALEQATAPELSEIFDHELEL